jgi:DNA polymerase-3 subunit alpha
LPPDINESFHEFAVVPGKEQIRFGLDAIKNVGHGAVEEVLRARQASGGRFGTVEDFCKHVDARIVNRKGLESLIKSGAFDSLGDRSRLVNNVENILSLSQRLQKESLSGQVDLFGGGGDGATKMKMRWDEESVAYSQNVQLAWERELLGLYLSRHPLEDYEELLSRQTSAIGAFNTEMDGRTVKVGGSITAAREITTKNGSKMAFIKLADLTGEIELIVFPKLYEAKPELWTRDNVLLAKGRLTTRDRNDSATDDWKVIVEEASLLTTDDVIKPSKTDKSAGTGEINENKQRLFIRLASSSDQPLLMSLKDKLDSFTGDTEVVIVTGEAATKQAIKLPQTINISEESLRALAAIFGPTNIVVR